MSNDPSQEPRELLADLPISIRALTNVELARLKSRYPNVPTGPSHCPTCAGTKTFRWYADFDKKEIAEFRCRCTDQWMLNLYLLNSNIGDVYQRLGWSDVEVEPGAVEKVMDYMDHLDQFVRAGCGLILHGEMGAGKTLLSTLVLKHALGKGYDGYFTTFSEMIDTYTGGWHDAEEKTWFHRRIKNAKVLVLDDVGREYQGRKQSGLPESTFDEVLRHRVAAGTPTIITTNLSLKRVQEGYGGNVMSLLQERSTTYEFTGEDYRRRAQKRLEHEVREGLVRPLVLA